MSTNTSYENKDLAAVNILKQAFDCSPEIILIIDPWKIKFVYANQTALTSLGYTKEEFLSKKPEDIDTVYTHEAMATAFDQILKSKEQHATFPTVHRKKDGSTYEVEVYLSCFKEKRSTYILVSATKKSVLKKAQEELTFHSTLLRNISDAIVSTDENFIITSWNKYAEEIFEWSAEEVLGKSARSFITELYPEAVIEEVEQSLFNNGFWKGEILSRKNKGTFPAFISMGVLRNDSGRITGTVSVLKDITERKKKEGQIRYLADLVNKVSDAIISVDKNYRIVSWNKGAETIYGFEGKEVVGKNIFHLWDGVTSYSKIGEAFRTVLQTGYWHGELKYLHKNNAEVWTLVSASVLRDENEVLTGFVVVAKDISEQKKLEAELRKLNDKLEKRVQEKTAEVKEILERVSDSVVALDNRDCYTYVNSKADILLQRPPGYLVGKHLWTEFPGSVGQPFEKAYKQAVATKQYQYSVAFDHDLKRWIENHFYPSSTGVSIYGRDVTERKKADLALEESELKYRTIVETAQEGIWQIDEDNNTVFVNNYMALLLGYTPGEIIGKNVIDFVGEENREKVLLNIEERKKGFSRQHEISFPTREQRRVDTLIQSTPIFRGEEYFGSLSTILDITERKQAEERLVANEKRFRALIENSSDGISLISKEGVLLYNSLSGEKITGYKNEEIVGSNRLTNIHPEDRDQINTALKQIVEKPAEVTKIEFRYRVADGSYKWLEGSYSNMLNEPAINAIVSNYRDITERKKTEQQLQKSQQQLSLIYNSTKNAMWLVTVEDRDRFRIETINNAYTDITGIEKEKAEGQLIENVLPAKNIGMIKAKYLEAVQTGQEVTFFTTTQFKHTKVTAEIKMIPLKNEEGKVVQLLGTGINVTEQNKARQELVQMNLQLRELASHLQTVREDERTSMAREIHDELGQQLTALKMDISWLNKKLLPGNENLESKLKGGLELIDSTINTVRKIAAELRPSILDDLGLAEAIEWQSKEFTKRTGIPVNYSRSGHGGKLPPDISIGIFRILQESLTNVARHANATRVDCLLENSDGNLILTITDNGAGFDSNLKGKRKTLGLLGMKERVMMLNGKYDITSKPGRGTTVSVEVPLRATAGK